MWSMIRVKLICTCKGRLHKKLVLSFTFNSVFYHSFASFIIKSRQKFFFYYLYRRYSITRRYSISWHHHHHQPFAVQCWTKASHIAPNSDQFWVSRAHLLSFLCNLSLHLACRLPTRCRYAPRMQVVRHLII